MSSTVASEETELSRRRDRRPRLRRLGCREPASGRIRRNRKFRARKGYGRYAVNVRCSSSPPPCLPSCRSSVFSSTRRARASPRHHPMRRMGPVHRRVPWIAPQKRPMSNRSNCRRVHQPSPSATRRQPTRAPRLRGHRRRALRLRARRPPDLPPTSFESRLSESKDSVRRCLRRSSYWQGWTNSSNSVVA